jgi:glycosyltransferase involved in cell wall biosynthesis
MTQVCHFTSVHRWNDIRILQKQCVSLAANGFQVSLVAFDAAETEFEGVQIINAGKTPKNRKERLQKGRKIIENIVFNQNARIFHFHDPELIPIAKKLQKKGKIVIYDIHEDVPKQILDKPYYNKTKAQLISKMFEIYENHSIKYFSALSCATPHISKRFINKHSHVVTINNYPLFQEITLTENISNHRQNSICYIGGITRLRGILQLIEALGYCHGVRLNLAGDFSEEKLRQEAMTSLGWKYVNELGFIDRASAQSIKEHDFAGVVNFLPAANHINAQPNKFFEYMASGLPVICSNFPLWIEFMKQYECGICVNPNDPKQLAEAILFLKNNPQKAMQMGINGRRAVEHKLNWNAESQKLIELYNKLLQQ